jgi:hypothetical protein
MAIKGILSNTLCWKCKRATDSSCSWSKEFKPVEGWEAVQTTIKGQSYRNTYRVKKCPKFVRG